MKLLTAKAISEALSVSISTVYLWAAEGILHPVRIGRIVRFDSKEIESLIKEGKSSGYAYNIRTSKRPGKRGAA